MCVTIFSANLLDFIKTKASAQTLRTCVLHFICHLKHSRHAHLTNIVHAYKRAAFWLVKVQNALFNDLYCRGMFLCSGNRNWTMYKIRQQSPLIHYTHSVLFVVKIAHPDSQPPYIGFAIKRNWAERRSQLTTAKGRRFITAPVLYPNVSIAASEQPAYIFGGNYEI